MKAANTQRAQAAQPRPPGTPAYPRYPALRRPPTRRELFLLSAASFSARAVVDRGAAADTGKSHLRHPDPSHPAGPAAAHPRWPTAGLAPTSTARSSPPRPALPAQTVGDQSPVGTGPDRHAAGCLNQPDLGRLRRAPGVGGAGTGGAFRRPYPEPSSHRCSFSRCPGVRHRTRRSRRTSGRLRGTPPAQVTYLGLVGPAKAASSPRTACFLSPSRRCSRTPNGEPYSSRSSAYRGGRMHAAIPLLQPAEQRMTRAAGQRRGSPAHPPGSTAGCPAIFALRRQLKDWVASRCQQAEAIARAAVFDAGKAPTPGS